MFSQEADDDEASEDGEQVPSAKTLFGAPAQNPPVRNDQAQGPWGNPGGVQQEGEATPQTLAPWAMRKGEGAEDQRSTLVGMPKLSRKKRPEPLNPPAARSAAKKRRPARQKTQLGGPNAADAKKAAEKAAAQAAEASNPEPKPKPSRKKDDVRHTYMGLPALDLDADDELAALVMETFADDLELPSKEEIPAKAGRKPPSKVRHTTQIPALFAAQSLESEEIEDDGKETAPPWQPPSRSKTRGEIKPSPGAEEESGQSAEVAEGQLFKFPARKSLRSQDRSANRTTLTGVPVVSNASEPEENDNDSSAPGQYILRKKDLSRAPEKIRINALLKTPSREGESKDTKTTIGISGPKPDGGLGATNTTMRLSVPVVGSEDGAKTELDPRLGQRKPSTTMRLSVPVVGSNDGKKVELTPSPAPGQQVASSSAVAARGAKTPAGRRGLSAAPAVTARLSVPAAVKKHMEAQAAEEDAADTIIQPPQSHPEPQDHEGFTSADTLQTDNIEPLLQAQRAAQQAQNVGFLETQEFSPPDEVSSDDDEDMFDIDVAEEPVRSVTPGYGEPPKILSSATSQPGLSSSPAPSQPVISQPQRSSGPVSVSGPPSSSASIPAQTARVPAQAPVTQSSPVLAGGSPVASDAAVRASALLGGGLMLLVPVFYIAALGVDGVKALPPLGMMSIFFPALGGLIAMLSGVIKFHPVMRATILTLVGSISLTLFALADLVPANAYGDTLSRLLVAAAIMLPVGLVWRARYPASGLSRIVVALGMVLLLVNYFLPTEDGALRLMSLLGSLSETPLTSAVALIPLALLVPSLGAFAGAKTTGGGLIWTALLCVWLLAMCVVGALVVPEAALLAFAGGGLGLMAATLCASMGFGDLLGWLTLPEEES